MSNTFACISSWQRGSGACGLRSYRFDPRTGKLDFIEHVRRDVSFNVTHYDKKRRLLYALEESDSLPGLRSGGGGRVFVFRIDSDTGGLTEIGCRETWSVNPSFLTLDATGKYLLVANHGSKAAVTKFGKDPFGNYFPVVEHDDVGVQLFSVNQEGVPEKLMDVVLHQGCGPDRKQLISRPHSMVMSPCGGLFAVCDKGNDTVRMYALDRDQGKLIEPSHVWRHRPGTLPRYCLFHPEKPWLYHNNEAGTHIHGFAYDRDGLLRELGSWITVPEDAQPQEPVLEQQGLAMDPAGRYLYNVVRGHNVVAVLELDQASGAANAVQYQPIAGKWPRGCAISPDGRFLLVCCLESGTVIPYAVGPDGRLHETGREYANPGAAYVSFCQM